MKITQSPRFYFLLGFLAISGGAAGFSATTPPSGPWDGLYWPFWELWICLGMAVLSFVVAIMFSERRQVSISALWVSLLALCVALPTISWGVPYGIRDPWTHLYYIKATQFFGSNPYPMFHSLVMIASETIGVDTIDVLARSQVIAPAIGAVWLVIVLRLLGNWKIWTLALIMTFPAIYLWVISRPYSIAPLLIFLMWWGLISQQNFKRRLILLFAILVASVFWHPMTSIAAGIIIAVWWAVKQAADMTHLNKKFKTQLMRVNTLHLGVFLLVLFIYHILVLSTVGRNVIARFVLESEGAVRSGNTVSASITKKFFEFIRRAIYLIGLGIVSLWGLTQGWVRERLSQPLVVALASGAALAILFVIIDLLSPIGFGARRANVLAPIILFPAAVIGLQRLPIPAGRVFVALVILTAGITTVYSSPLIGGVEISTTSSDIQAINWMDDNRVEGPIVGSEFTYSVIIGQYGIERAADWSNDRLWQYQWGARQFESSWNAPRDLSRRYTAVSYPARIKANRSQDQQQRLSSFQSTGTRIYDNGNYWWYFHPEN